MSGAGSPENLLALPLDRILVDPALQPRVAGLDAKHVAALQDNPEAWGPLIVVAIDGGYVLVDGFHRLAAAQNLGMESVTVEVREPPADGDLRALAFALNVVHGKLLLTADRRAEAERLLQVDPDISNMEVARRAGISPTTAGCYRRELERSGAIDAAEQRISRSGVAYRPPVPRQRGELPADREPIGSLLGPKERREQRRLVRYFERLAVALDDGFSFDRWQSAADAATACRAVLGSKEAAELGIGLGPAARNVLDVAIALGYEDDET